MRRERDTDPPPLYRWDQLLAYEKRSSSEAAVVFGTEAGADRPFGGRRDGLSS